MINLTANPINIYPNSTSFRHYLLASGNNEVWERVHIENKIKVVKKVAFLHSVLNDAVAEINGIFTIEVLLT